MSAPTDRRYSDSHEWFKVDGDLVTVGISQYAADELTDITYVDLPVVGATIDAGAEIGEIESVKATSELITAVGGEIIEVNAALADTPEKVNEDAFESGWMLKIKTTDLAPLEKLKDATAYDAHCATN